MIASFGSNFHDVFETFADIVFGTGGIFDPYERESGLGVTSLAA